MATPVAAAITGTSLVPVIVTVAVWATLAPCASITLYDTVMTLLSPWARLLYAATDGSTVSVLPESENPAGKVAELALPSIEYSTVDTCSVALSASAALVSSSTVEAVVPSATVEVTGADTVGASLAPAMVTVMTWAVPSAVVTVMLSV